LGKSIPADTLLVKVVPELASWGCASARSSMTCTGSKWTIGQGQLPPQAFRRGHDHYLSPDQVAKIKETDHYQSLDECPLF
jgi:hypothetical protein